MDNSQYLEIFIDETKEHLQNLNEQILVIEAEPENMDTINEIFRAAHSLKGMAGTMEFKRMQKLTHQMENVFSEIRNGKMKVASELIDVLFECLDALEGYLEIISETGMEGEDDHQEILDKLAAILGTNGSGAGGVKAQTGQKQAGEGAGDGSDKKKYRQFAFSDDEKAMIDFAYENELKVYALTVYIEETCLLKSARSFLVFKNLAAIGEVIKTDPPSRDIEDERFDFDFSICVVSKEPLERVMKAIKRVSEIKEVVGEQIYSSSHKESTEKASDEKKQEQVSGGDSQGTKETASKAISQEKPAEKPKEGEKVASKAEKKSVATRSVRVDIEKLDVLMNLVSELIIAKNGLASQKMKEMAQDAAQFSDHMAYLERVTANIRESVMNVRMMPIEMVTQKFPRMIRDLNKKLGKNMELHMTGEDTELDRTVIDEIGDPLMHLLRNSADHGLEMPEVRKQRGKPEKGNIRLDAYQNGNTVVIEVGDDGNGIDVEAVKSKAVERGTLTPEEAKNMSEKDAIGLLFMPSFSTAKVVSDISGRGVGLDVVKTKIESLGGEIDVKTKLHEGSTFVIRLPLTLAIIQALMVEVGKERYAISLANIENIENYSKEKIQMVGQQEVMLFKERLIPVIWLADVLDLPRSEGEDELTVLIIKKGDKFAGFVVDRLIGQQEIVIKSLGKYLENVNKVIGGATIMGDGGVALILDVNTLV